MGAVGLRDAAEFVHGCNEGADEEKVNKADKMTGAFGRSKAHDRDESPGCSQSCDDEQGQDVGGRKLIRFLEAVNEVCLITI